MGHGMAPHNPCRGAALPESTHQVCLLVRTHVLQRLKTRHREVWEEYGAAREAVLDAGARAMAVLRPPLGARHQQMVDLIKSLVKSLVYDRSFDSADAELLKLCREFPRAPSRRQPRRACAPQQSFWDANPGLGTVAAAVARLADAVHGTMYLPAERGPQCMLFRDLTTAAGLPKLAWGETRGLHRCSTDRELWLLLDGQLLTDHPHDPDRGDRYLPAGVSHSCLEGSAYSTTVDEPVAT